MKKIVLVVAGVFAFVACEKKSNEGFTIAGTAEGFENGNKVILQVQGDMDMIAKDTAVIENGKFEMIGNSEIPEFGFLTLENNTRVPLILENGTISVILDKDSIQNSVVKGTPENDFFQEYTTNTKSIYKRISSFQKNNQEKFMTAQGSNDTVTMNALMDQLKNIQDELTVLAENTIKNNPKKYLTILLLENQIMMQTITPEVAKSYFDNINEKYKNTKNALNIKKTLEAFNSVEIGKAAPDFSAPSPEGKTISLKESLGKVTIIDFWASWCGPCRAENPNVVALYNELHEKGLNIIGVSLDKDADKWKAAIEKDGLTWNQVSNLKFWQDPIAEQYNVKSIPATFILDENGIIVAKDLRGEALKAKVKELLGL
ncbi:redoxin domain-containing protein [Flavobacterium chuncheonense]|uniref:Redoxin domain-containing protein n=1 Tax=Flavobacterium chuncheonense TaxID=2026653 RepID=A0ABW5YJI3_9FLAO